MDFEFNLGRKKRLTNRPSAKSFNPAFNPLLKLACSILLAKLAPTKPPRLALRYNPVPAIAICVSSTPAASATNVVAETIPVPKPPGAMYKDSQSEVCPCQRRTSKR